MEYWTAYKGHTPIVCGKRKLYDGTIYTVDIETTSYLKHKNGKIYPAADYKKFNRDDVMPGACMYVWQLGINEKVYYGRTWEELFEFIDLISESTNHITKIFWIHNLSFEFQFMYRLFSFDKVFARKKRKPMFAIDSINAIEFRCSLMLSNARLEQLPDFYNLNTKKLVGDLDYTLIRHSKTPLSEQELKYCENDCLVLYEYIKHELLENGSLKAIPRTSTGKLRSEFKTVIASDWEYKNRTRRMIDADPIVFNLLVEAFAGGYTHGNWVYIDEVLKFIESLDATSQYPTQMCLKSHFPKKHFTKCNVTKRENMLKNFCYIMRIEFFNGKSRYDNHFISSSKCRNIEGGVYDNGRLAAFKHIEITITDVDLDTILKSYGDHDNLDQELSYKIITIYKAPAGYLPKTFIEFILEKYQVKTKLKGVEDPMSKILYAKGKNAYNSLYGMSVTNTIRDEVIFKHGGWQQDRPLENDEIIEKLEKQLNQPFMAFSTGVFVTALARADLINLIMKNDEFNVYSDTDSLKLRKGYDELSIWEYNENIKKMIDKVCNFYDLNKDLFFPEDIKGNKHMLGKLEMEEEYKEFKTTGAKKYCVRHMDDSIEITVAGVPKKKGSKAIKSLDEFEDGFVFEAEVTNKQVAVYLDDQEPINLTDYTGITYNVSDRTGVCLLPADYTMGKSSDFDSFLSSARAVFKEV